MTTGHQKIKDRILRDGLPTPSVAVFSGPSSVGKKALAKEILAYFSIHPEDQYWADKLTADSAKQAYEFAHVAPRTGSKRALALPIDGASPTALNRLLKTLEDPELPLVTILFSRGVAPLPPTIASRAIIYNFGLLSNKEIENILTEHYRFKPETAHTLASRSAGTVASALSAARTGKPKLGVLVAVKAIQERDSDTLLRVANDWTDEHTEALVAWCNEAVTHRWRMFTEDEVGPQRGFKLPLKILTALATAETRPRLVVRAALMDVLKKES